ncbi:MAG: Ldh family oxidoreductase [Bacteroidales bacterium]|nr:Ldh family oxidoreductase [Bacteroidales bacterium]
MIYDHKFLLEFTTEIFMRVGCSRDDAAAVAAVLVKAELRNHASHGMIRVREYYELWKSGRVNVTPDVKVVHETPSTAVVDGDSCFGMVAGVRSMRLAIEKASATGTGWVAARNSNHFGIAGYYAMMALEHEMVGITVTNANPLVVPTFSVSRLLGTNPLAVAVPAMDEPPFVADFATTPIARGKLAVSEKKGEKVPTGYVQDAKGNPSDDPGILRRGGGMVTLGGDRLHGSHKGYCMSAVVDIFSALFSGANFGPFVPPSVAYLPVPVNQPGMGTGHFFGAMKIDAFRPAREFREAMDHWIRTFRNAKPTRGEERVLIPGDPEREAEKHNLASGIGLVPAVVEDLRAIAAELGFEFRQ